MYPSAALKSIWYARDDVLDMLRGLGVPPASIDGTYAIIRDFGTVAKWVSIAKDPYVSRAFISSGAKMESAVGMLDAVIQNGPLSGAAIKMLAPTGFSFDSRGFVRFDGCAVSVTTENGASFIVPVSRKRISDGAEWVETVAVCPMADVSMWTSFAESITRIERELDASEMVMRVYNGPDLPISPVSLGEMVLDLSVLSAFVDDVTGFLGRRNWYEQRGLTWKRSYLLNGPPGTGKTSLARWAATNLGLPCMGFDFTDPLADGRDLNACLRVAARKAPCVLVLDDIDKVLSGQNSTRITPHALQTALSGMGNISGVIIVATSNSTDVMFSELSDGGQNPLARRFDQIIEVPLPTRDLRMAYATRLLQSDDVSADVVDQFINDTDGWSYDDIRAAVTAAANAAVKRQAAVIGDCDIRSGVITGGFRKISRSERSTPDDQEGD